MPLALHAPEDIYICWFSNLFTLSIPYEVYSRVRSSHYIRYMYLHSILCRCALINFMTIVTGGPGAVYTSGAPEFTPDLVGFVSFFAWLLCCLSLFDLRIFFITHLAFSSYSSTYISKPSD
jgi:hypothetical protein